MGAAILAEGDDQEETTPVLESNWTALKLFIDLGTQWRVTQMGGGMAGSTPVFLGLDYACVDALMRRRKIRDAAVFDDLLILERAALQAFAGLPETEVPA